MSHDEHAECWPRIPGYQAGDLSDEDRARVDAHLATCVECSSQLEEVLAVELPPEPPRRGARRFIPDFRNPHPAWRAILSGAVVVFLGVVGVIIEQIETPEPGSQPSGEKLIALASPDPRLREVERPRDVIYERKGIPRDDADVLAGGAPVIRFSAAAESDHNESADAEAFRSMKSDTASFLSYIKGEPRSARPAVYDTMGVGAGGGSGGSYGGRMSLTVRGQGSAGAEDEPRATRDADQVAPVASKLVVPQVQDDAPRQSRKLIRSGEMEFEIDSFDSAVATLTKIAVEEAGFIATVNSEKLQNGKVRGIVVVRVPPKHLDTLLLKLRALGDLKSQRIGSEDVTKSYMDLESRLRAAKTMEERLIAIIKDGKGSIKDLLAAEKELGEWRTKIEQMIGEINYYNNLIEHSTLAITLTEKEIRAPFGLIETERVEMGLEVEDAEKAYTAALAAVAEAKGRVSRSELKQLEQGQFNAIIQFEAAPAAAGPLRDRLKQLGALARLDIRRTQDPQGGSGKPQDAKIRQNDTQFQVSLYNLANIAPRETVQVTLACTDAEQSYKDVLDRVEKAAGRVLSSNLSRQKADQTTGRIQFQVKAADAEAVLQDVRAAGEVLRLEVTETTDTSTATRTKRGFNISFFGLGSVQPRETSTVVLASKDVAAAYRALLDAAKVADARIVGAQLNESDRKNMMATLSVEIRRERETALAEAAAKAGDVYTRTSSRAPESENVVDSKTLIHFRLFNAASIPARETVTLSVEVNDVDATSKALEAEFRGRIVDAKQTRDASGRRESSLTIDVPLKDAAGAAERIKGLGTVLEHGASKNTEVPDNDLALARLEVKVSNEVLLGRDSGPWANLKRGLSISLQAGSWALMLIMIGVCFVCPLLLAVWGALKLRRRFAAKPAPAA
ncbi:MAG TPA: DUF4349 domain-containing protein [Planctomycetota bacterium]|nr:DUF4349 domain-containing protein [Planctomycetota bacterium]